MFDMIEANWLVFGAVLLLALLIAWWIWRRARRLDRRRAESADVLTPGAAPAERNSLLVDAPSATSYVTTAPIAGIAPDVMGGMGELIAAATAEDVGARERAAAEPTPGDGQTDDLTRIKGLGPKLSARFAELGITRYAQIAAWSDEDAASIDAQLGAFQGRIARDRFVDQARFLAAGDIAGYEAQFGKL